MNLTKTCNKCNIEKCLDEYYKRNGKHRNTCKQCRNEYVKKWKHERKLGKELVPKQKIINNKLTCKKCFIEKDIECFTRRNDSSNYRSECNACKKKILQEYCTRVYNEIRRNKRKNPCNKLISNHRLYIYKCLTKFKLKRDSSVKYIGCHILQLKKWIEYQFDKDMNWNNYGTLWTIDHVLPLSKFDMTKYSEQLIAFNWKNLKPSKDNFSKSNKIYVWEYFNNFISAHRFITYNKLDSSEYQGLCESLNWLRLKLKDGKNLTDE